MSATTRASADRRPRSTSTVGWSKSARSLQLDEVTVDRLRDWRDQQAVQRERARDAWEELDIVATTARGNPVDRHSFARSLKRLCGEVGIDPPISPYELRHTAIAMQADASHTSWEIADWAGTSEAMISEVYRHRLRQIARIGPAW